MNYYKLGMLELRSAPPAEYFDAKQLLKGTQIEFEHTNNPFLAMLIAKHHLLESPDYYKALERMEKNLPAVNSRANDLVERASVAGFLDLPEPLPTILIYFLMLVGAIVWVKSGGF